MKKKGFVYLCLIIFIGCSASVVIIKGNENNIDNESASTPKTDVKSDIEIDSLKTLKNKNKQ